MLTLKRILTVGTLLVAAGCAFRQPAGGGMTAAYAWVGCQQRRNDE